MGTQPNSLLLILAIVLVMLALGSVARALVAVAVALAQIGMVLVLVLVVLGVLLTSNGCAVSHLPEGGVQLSAPDRFRASGAPSGVR